MAKVYQSIRSEHLLVECITTVLLLLVTYHISRIVWRNANKDDTGPPLREHYTTSDHHNRDERFTYAYIVVSVIPIKQLADLD